MSVFIKTNKLLTKLYHRFIENGIAKGDTLKNIKLVRLTNTFGIICFLYAVSMGTISAFNRDLGLFLFDFLIASLLVVNYFWLSKTKNINLSADIIIVLLFITFTFLIIHGGKNGTGPIWSLIFPSVALQLKGCKKGSIYTLVYFLTMFIILFVLSDLSWINDYRKDFSEPESVGLRILLVYVAIFIASYTFNKNSQDLIKENERLSLTDVLTGLANRRKINDTIKIFIEKFKRSNFIDSQVITKLISNNKPYSFGLILCDIDNFKLINDKYGHPVGDIALKLISGFLVKSLRNIDFVGRWGGEEFLIILDETDLKGAVEVGEKLRAAVEQHIFKLKNMKANMTLSFGISCFDIMQDINLFISKIDSYLNKAKRKGKNCVVFG